MPNHINERLLSSARDDDGIITRLTNELSQKNEELNARTFALNHANLQLSALEGREQESRGMVEQLRNDLSLAQQDNLLLEVSHRPAFTSFWAV